MPCYEPPLEHEEREREFLVAALCHATKRLTATQLAGFPGLAEWTKRHDFIDNFKKGHGWEAKIAYEESCGRKYDAYAAPLFMKQFMEAFPSKKKRR